MQFERFFGWAKRTVSESFDPQKLSLRDLLVGLGIAGGMSIQMPDPEDYIEENNKLLKNN